MALNIKDRFDKTQKFRAELAQMFITALEENQLDWKQGWQGIGFKSPMNFANNTRYKGINRLYLSLCMMKFNWIDNRFMTFNQIKSKGWRLRAGAKSCKVEYWMPFDFMQKRVITWTEYHELLEKAQEEENTEKIKVGLVARYYNVFNGAFIDGIAPLETTIVNENIKSDEIIEKISTGLGVEILNDGGNRAYYSPSQDKIHLPLATAFYSGYDYNSTALHELAHSTGAKHRLNRDLSGDFGSESYAKEELVAEITSSFMGVYLAGEGQKSDFSNHKAYVQSWIQAIKEKPSTLFESIKLAEKATQYMEQAAGLGLEEKIGLKDEEQEAA